MLSVQALKRVQRARLRIFDPEAILYDSIASSAFELLFLEPTRAEEEVHLLGDVEGHVRATLHDPDQLLPILGAGVDGPSAESVSFSPSIISAES